MLTHDKIIPSSVDITNKALRLEMVLKHKKEKSALLIVVSVPNDFWTKCCINHEHEQIPGSVKCGQEDLEIEEIWNDSSESQSCRND